jgi:hypothetical protein
MHSKPRSKTVDLVMDNTMAVRVTHNHTNSQTTAVKLWINKQLVTWSLAIMVAYQER